MAEPAELGEQSHDEPDERSLLDGLQTAAQSCRRTT
jgi:hypothetical protein